MSSHPLTDVDGIKRNHFPDCLVGLLFLQLLALR
jgi:hypothetical protein